VYLWLDKAGRRRRLTNHAGKEFAPVSQDGREYAAFRGRGACCPNPAKWAGAFPLMPKSRYVVPAANCKACEFHEPAKKYGRLRYARCRWYRENSGLEHPAEILKNSITQARELLR
jgi:hypothetical protein